jgi:mono/diheme cytochrome c family protein
MRRYALAVALLLTACVAGVFAAQAREHDPTWVAPEDAAARPNPLAGRTELAAGGRKVFLDRCETCHAADARGSDKAPDLTQPAVQAQTDGELFWKISAGNAHAGMPTFSFLPEAQRWQLVLYLRGLQQP